MQLIALSGFKRAGKDTAARALIRAGYVRIAFADPVREEVFAQYPQARSVPDAEKDIPMSILDGRSVRMLLIEHGMGMREQDPDYWVNKARERIEPLLEQGRRVVVSDARLDNELAMLESLGALKIWVQRPGCAPDGHVTERDLRERADLVVNNLGSEEDLARKMMGVLGKRCGACEAMKRDGSFPRYGFCTKAPSQEQKARLVQTEDECLFGAYSALKGFVPA